MLLKNHFFVLLVFLGNILIAQGPKIFTTSDFDLVDNVKTCTVITSYGKEYYEFDKAGRLTKLETKFSDDDYDITYYKIKDNALTEKRVEHYIDGEFDAATSLAYFYSYTEDSKKITEKIYSYDKLYTDVYQYSFNTDNKLTKTTRFGPDGEDETQVTYRVEDKVKFETTLLNSKIEKIKKSFIDETTKDSTVTTFNYIDGLQNTKIIEVFGASKMLKKQVFFTYDFDKISYVETQQMLYEYSDREKLQKKTSIVGEEETAKEFIYQFDAEEGGNWVKQIITPDNTYVTRRITYYEATLVTE